MESTPPVEFRDCVDIIQNAGVVHFDIQHRIRILPDDVATTAFAAQFLKFGEKLAAKAHRMPPLSPMAGNNDIAAGQVFGQHAIAARPDEGHIGETNQAAAPRRQMGDTPSQARAHSLFGAVELECGPIPAIPVFQRAGAGDYQDLVDGRGDGGQCVFDQATAICHGRGQLTAAKAPTETGRQDEGAVHRLCVPRHQAGRQARSRRWAVSRLVDDAAAGRLFPDIEMRRLIGFGCGRLPAADDLRGGFMGLWFAVQ